MSPFKSSAVKGGSSKGKKPIIDIDEPSPRAKRTRFSTEVYDLDMFRSYAEFQTYRNYFQDAPLLVERAVDQSSLSDINIPIWFATKDWNFLLSTLEDAYENMVKEFYANAIVNRGDKLLGERKEFLSNSCLFGENPTHATLESSSSTPHVYDE